MSEINIPATMDAIVSSIAASSGGKVSKEQILERLKAKPRYNRWKVRRVDQGSDEAFWIAANPALLEGRVFPRVMPDGRSGWDAAQEYVIRVQLSQDATHLDSQGKDEWGDGDGKDERCLTCGKPVYPHPYRHPIKRFGNG